MHTTLVVILTCLIASVAGPPMLPSATVAEPAPTPREVHPVSRSSGPRLIHRVEPHFPRKAARAGLKEAMVVVQLMVDPDGHTRDPQVIQSDPVGLGFEEAALRAVTKWRYEPLIANGEVKVVVQIVKVEFHRDRHEA